MPSEHPIPVRGLDHIVLRVADLEAMMAFHGEALGCRVERPEGDGPSIYLRDPERNTVELKGPPSR